MSDTYPFNRRDAIAHLGGAALAVGILSRSRTAMGAPDAAVPSDSSAAFGGDDTTLNALLEAELNAISAYTVGAQILGAAEDSGAPDAGGDPNAALAPVALAIAAHFRSQHMMHADALTALIVQTNGLPIAASTFVPPTGFKPSVLNVIKLACNAERAAAVSYTAAQKGLTSSQSAKLAAAIGGVETQHFVVLYALLQGLIAGNSTTLMNAASIVPEAFVGAAGSGTTGLEAIPAFTYDAGSP